MLIRQREISKPLTLHEKLDTNELYTRLEVSKYSKLRVKILSLGTSLIATRPYKHTLPHVSVTKKPKKQSKYIASSIVFG